MSGPLDLSRYNWSRYKAVLFDVDGTLYNQSRLRRIMAVELAVYSLLHPLRWRDPFILSRFRKLREEMFETEEDSLLEAQYRWTAKALNIPPDRVRRIADEWLLKRPLRHLRSCRPEGLDQLFARIRNQGIRIGVFSDYPAVEKLKALDLSADLVGSALDPHINRLKPHTAGLAFLTRQFNVSPAECIHIGDREDRDGICADQFGCHSLILSGEVAARLGPERSYDLLFPAG